MKKVLLNLAGATEWLPGRCVARNRDERRQQVGRDLTPISVVTTVRPITAFMIFPVPQSGGVLVL